MDLRQKPALWKTLWALPAATRWLLFGIGLSRIASFMVWPFIVVAMNRRFGTPITDIGAQLALGALISIVLSPLSGFLGDTFNARNLMGFGPGRPATSSRSSAWRSPTVFSNRCCGCC